MAAKMQQVMNVLEDTLVSRMTIPGTLDYEMNGNGLKVAVGPAKEVLYYDHQCMEWKVSSARIGWPEVN